MKKKSKAKSKPVKKVKAKAKAKVKAVKTKAKTTAKKLKTKAKTKVKAVKKVLKKKVAAKTKTAKASTAMSFKKLGQQGNAILEDTKNLVTDAKNSLVENYEEAKKTVQDTQQKVIAKIKEQPVAATAAAIGAGLIASKLAGGGSKTEQDTDKE